MFDTHSHFPYSFLMLDRLSEVVGRFRRQEWEEAGRRPPLSPQLVDDTDSLRAYEHIACVQLRFRP